MQRIHVGGILLAAMLLSQATVQAGFLNRREDDLPSSVMARLLPAEETLSEAHATIWGRFLDDLERARGRVRRPAVLDPKRPDVFEDNDLGDHFLKGFRKERGLNRKLRTLAEYRIAFQRAEEWVVSLEAPQRSSLMPAIESLRAEVNSAESILIAQIGGDLTRGGGALRVTVQHVNRSGFTEAIAETAFGGLAQGLKRELTNLASTGQIDEEARSAHAEQIQLLEQVIQGQE